jgi:hypothetical protein
VVFGRRSVIAVMDAPPTPADRQHLLDHARKLFPSSSIDLSYDLESEVIYVHVDAAEFVFEIGSDDDAYVFVGQHSGFTIPLMDPDDMA